MKPRITLNSSNHRGLAGSPYPKTGQMWAGFGRPPEEDKTDLAALLVNEDFVLMTANEARCPDFDRAGQPDLTTRRPV